MRAHVFFRASITSLEEVKAELQKSIDKKADEAALKELEALLQKMLKDFSGLRKLLEKDTAVAISELERRLMEVIEERVRTGGTIGTLDGAATVKSLITGREIPEQPEKVRHGHLFRFFALLFSLTQHLINPAGIRLRAAKVASAAGITELRARRSDAQRLPNAFASAADVRRRVRQLRRSGQHIFGAVPGRRSRRRLLAGLGILDQRPRV